MMSKIVFVMLLSLVMTLSPSYGQPPDNNSETAIKQLERELETALSKNDSAALERILADDYIEIDAQGGVKRKADVIALARARSAPSRGVSVGPEKTVDELAIRLFGDSALVVGRTTIRYQFMENQSSPSQKQFQNSGAVDQERFLRTYSKLNGHWQLIAWQTTSIAKR
jgi:hypothetical protein